jgi:2-(1,2-epoxy-1,2-dihydrophenyl)acetyl-CoA isomerase
MSTYETVMVERQGSVAVVSLNRPDNLNSFNKTLRRDLLLAVREVNGDDSVRVVVVTGVGSRPGRRPRGCIDFPG